VASFGHVQQAAADKRLQAKPQGLGERITSWREEQRRPLNFVLSNGSWEYGDVVATLRQPFDLAAEITAIAARSSAGNSGIP